MEGAVLPCGTSHEGSFAFEGRKSGVMMCPRWARTHPVDEIVVYNDFVSEITAGGDLLDCRCHTGTNINTKTHGRTYDNGKER